MSSPKTHADYEDGDDGLHFCGQCQHFTFNDEDGTGWGCCENYIAYLDACGEGYAIRQFALKDFSAHATETACEDFEPATD